MDHPYAINELILMLGLVARKFGNERSLPKALDSEDGLAHPNIIYEEPGDEASSSDKDVSDATLPAIKTLSIYIFVFWRRVWIREGNRSDVPLTQPGNGPEGTATWGMSASRRKAHFELWVIGRATLSDQGPGHKGPSTIQVRRSPEVTAMSRNLTHRPKRRANTRTSTIGVLRDINQGNKSGAYGDAAHFHFVEVPDRGKGLETTQAPFDLPEADADSVAGYNVEYARDAILNSSLLAEANVPGSRGLILTETRGGSLPT
ncbi:hypothetical protein L6452_40649 [Arctium lappa]|uniref:Uncharacterized protein n=1 Tax=Arctium lappa TaxID=4217 RepID=A0ACB8XNP1_ARCLA|nr:hypothetical protein L6452_40649 [Arctium lappa]